MDSLIAWATENKVKAIAIVVGAVVFVMVLTAWAG